MIRLRRLAAALALLTTGVSTHASAQWYQGPSGAPTGQPFDGWVLNQHATNIRAVQIQFGKATRVLQCVITEYPTKPNDPQSGESGSAGPANCNAGNPSDDHTLFQLDPNEYILGIGGAYTDHVTSLRFYTNKRNSPVYGEGGAGAPFGYTAPLGQMIVAFTQTNDTRLRSIGVMYAPCDPQLKACK